MRRLTLRLLTGVLTFAIGLLAFGLLRSSRPTTYEVLTDIPKRCEWPSSVGNDHATIRTDSHFPSVSFPDGVHGRLSTELYSTVLDAMEEPWLYEFVGEDFEAYRFTWLRSFHPPVVIRVWKTQNDRCITTKKLERTLYYQGPNPNVFQAKEMRPLTENEWAAFKELINLGAFWSMPTVERDSIGFDGAFWLMEGVSDRKYHVVTRQSPESGSYRETCLHLLKLSGLPIDKAHELY